MKSKFLYTLLCSISILAAIYIYMSHHDSIQMKSADKIIQREKTPMSGTQSVSFWVSIYPDLRKIDDIIVPKDWDFPKNIDNLGMTQIMYSTLKWVTAWENEDIFVKYLSDLFLEQWLEYPWKQDFANCFTDPYIEIDSSLSELKSNVLMMCSDTVPENLIFDKNMQFPSQRYRIWIFHKAYSTTSIEPCLDLMKMAYSDRSKESNAWYHFKNVVLCESIATRSPKKVKEDFMKMRVIVQEKKCDLYSGTLKLLCNNFLDASI